MFLKGMNRAIAPNHVVLFDRLQMLRALRERTRNGVKHEAGVKGGNEGDVDIQAGRVLDLGDFEAIHFFPLVFRDEINLANTVAIFCAFKQALQTGQAPA
jgi:hypothetical protein